MKSQCPFSLGLFLVLLGATIGEGVHLPVATEQTTNICRRAALTQMIGSLHNKTSDWAKILPKDRIKHQKLLDKDLHAEFMVNCSVQDQVLSFYQKEVFRGLQAASVPESILNIFDEIKRNLRKCVPCATSSTESSAIKQLKTVFVTIKDKGQQQRGRYKAISEIPVLIGWLNTYLHQWK